jgi:heterodisulfide reductase subunit A
VLERIGVYICECGPNIKDILNIDELVKYAGDLEAVVWVKRYSLLCSKESGDRIAKEIKEHRLTRVVIAGCSPKEHEHTFREILRKADLNPFLLQMANIREQCAWVIKDKKRATESAKVLIHAAVRRVAHHEPLEVKEIECCPDVLVVGAGVAGISAALTLSQHNRKVYVVEKAPCIGGKAARYEDFYHTMECAACVLDPVIDAVLHNGQIEVFTYSEVQEVLGYYGNFQVKIKQKARFVESKACLGCGLCFDVCPVTVKNAYNEGLNDRKAIYVPYAGAMPNVAVIDEANCMRFSGEACCACQEACPFDAINYEDTDMVQKVKVGAIVIATGFDIFDPKRAPEYGYGKIDNVYTCLEFERLLSSNGPTEGNILLKNGRLPRKIAFVHCVGSRTIKHNEHCSGVCCLYLLKFAHQVKQKIPEVSIVEFYSDFCLPGKGSQRFFNTVSREGGVEFIRTKKPGSIQINWESSEIQIKYLDVHGDYHTVSSDMVVLASAIEAPRDAPEIARIFDVTQGEDGFFIEEHPKINPVSTVREGIYIAGCSQGPKDIPGSIAQGQAAAGKILLRLIPGEKLALEPIIAEVDEGICSGCKICIGLCEYKAIVFDDVKKNVLINEILCRGCGICAVACPGGAIRAKHFTDQAICAEIKGLTTSIL